MFKTPEQRREENNKKIIDRGIACLETLPCVESSQEVKLKDVDLICKKALATMFAIQVACDSMNKDADLDESIKFFSFAMVKFGVTQYLTEKEKRIMEKSGNEQDIIDIGWEYESLWSLLWALGLVEDISIPNALCDVDYVISLVGGCNDYEEFKSKVHIRDIEEILDILDLYYRYHWATTEKRINPETNIADLNPDVVFERRKGLEWLISEIEDWDDISLNT